MRNAAQLRALMGGERRGPLAAITRGALQVASWPYRLGMALRNRSYDRHGGTGVPIPVISVGNLTVGGVGKTPLVAWLARWFRQHKIRVCVISRGYGAEAGARNDEARELELQLPDVPHLQNPDRLAAAATAIEEFESQLLILDDGFQHRRIQRDLDLVLLDALNPFGFGHLLPRGLLREPLAALRRAQAVILTRADAVDAERRGQIERQVRCYAPQAVWVEAQHAPRQLASAQGASRPVRELAQSRVAAFCGLGNPAGFRHTLASCGMTVAAFQEFPDHHPYGRDDVRQLVHWAEQQTDIVAVLCTQKDLVKLGVERLGPHPLWALQIGIELSRGEAELTELLTQVLDRVSDAMDRD